MNLESIKALATSKIARQALLAQKHSPKLLFAAGVVGVVGATVLACRATLKMDEVLEKAEKDQVEIDNVLNSQSDEEAYRKESIKLKTKTALEIVKLYAPSVGLGVVSVAALTGSHVILTKRNGAVMAAYAALDRGYKEYRKRVADEYGTDVDRKFALGVETVEVKEMNVDGTAKTIKKTVQSRNGMSPYAVLFDDVNSHKYSREPGVNAMILSTQQSHANDKLRAHGHLFLNEVHDMLGLPRTPAGQIVGWVWRRETEEKNGDNYVSFGVWDGDIERAEAFVNGDEKSIWLDFNVDGPVYNLI